MKLKDFVLSALLAFSWNARTRAADEQQGKDSTPLTPAHENNSGGSRSIIVQAKSEFSTYIDTDAVSVITPTLSASVSAPLSGWTAQGSYLVDIISAASIDIVSTASPHWTEVRHGGALAGTYKRSDLGVTLSSSVSSEPDYFSASGGGSVSLDLLQKNLVPTLGYTYTKDTAGVTGTPFSVYSLKLQRHSIDAALETVLDRSTVFSMVLGAIFESGEQWKPYRYLPMFTREVASAIPNGASVAQVNELRLPGRTAERTPLSRARYALSGRLAKRFSGSTFVGFERLYADDWGLRATTADLRFVIDVSERVFVWPHVRTHVQSGVSFWKRAYVAELLPDNGLEVPRYRTGDRELGPLVTGTLGAGIRWNIGASPEPSDLSLVLEAEGAKSEYLDTLFIASRLAGYGDIQLEAKF